MRSIRREAVARAARERSEQERESPPLDATRSHLSAWPLSAQASRSTVARPITDEDVRPIAWLAIKPEVP